MSQKFVRLQNKNPESIAFGNWYATAVYDQHFIDTDELGGAMKHYFELGQKVKLDGIGIFKVGFSSIGTKKREDCGAQNITTRRVLFQPETERVVVGQTTKDGKVVQKYVVAKTLVKDVVFEETYDTAMKADKSDGEG